MPQITLTNREILQLEAEILGLTDQKKQVILQGLLAAKLPLKLKFKLNQVGELASKYAATFRRVNEEFAKTHGSIQADGSVAITSHMSGEGGEPVLNPAFDKYMSELRELEETTVSLEHPELLLEDFENLETTEVYPIFYKLLKAA